MDESYTTELLVRYIDGELDSQQVQALEKRLAEEPALKQELDQLEAAMHTVSLVASEQKIKGIHSQMVRERNNRKGTVVSMFSRTSARIAAAAILVVVAGFGWWVMNTGADQIREDHFVEYSIGTSRSAGGNGTIEDLFSKKEYAEVVNYALNNKVAGSDSLLVAISFLETGKNREAVDWLTQLQDVPKFSADADYYLGFAYLAMGDRGMAYKVFKSIHDEPGHLYHSSVTDGMLWKIRFR